MPTIPGGPEWLIILLIFLLLFGAKKLPELSRSVGQSITSFKQGVHEAGDKDADAAADAADAADTAEGDADSPRADDGQAASQADDADLSKESRRRGDA